MKLPPGRHPGVLRGYLPYFNCLEFLMKRGAVVMGFSVAVRALLESDPQLFGEFLYKRCCVEVNGAGECMGIVWSAE